MMRHADASDLDVLVQLERDCFHTPWTRRALLGELRRGFVLLNHDATAYVVGLPVVDECELLRIAVHPAARQRGLGRDMLHAFHRHCQQLRITKTLLEVRSDNHAARHLYESTGYLIDGQRRGYYTDGHGKPVDAILYSRRLTFQTEPED